MIVCFLSASGFRPSLYYYTIWELVKHHSTAASLTWQVQGLWLKLSSDNKRPTRPVGALSSSLTVARGRARRTGVRRLWDTAGLGTSPRARSARGTWPVPLALSPVTATWPSRRDDWCLGDSPCLRLRSGVRDLRWPDPWELGRSAAKTLEATDLGCDELATVLDRLVLDDSWDLGRLVGKACLGACNSTESSIISVSFLAAFAAAAALLRFLCAVALACAVHASGSQSWHTRQGLSWVQRGKPAFKWHCWQRRWLSFRLRKWEHSGNFGCDSFDDDLSRDLSAIL